MDTQLVPQKTVNRGFVPQKAYSLSPQLHMALSTMFPFAPDYEWFDGDKFEKASQCFEAIIQAYGKNQSLVEFFKGAILDLQRKDEWEKVDFYHKERAEAACRLLANNEKPIVAEQIPSSVWIESKILYAQHTALQTWYPQIPFFALPDLARVTAKAMPDELILVTYREKVRSVVWRGDPLIYAQYGRWLVKLAEWQ